jgi:hypothetical protein
MILSPPRDSGFVSVLNRTTCRFSLSRVNYLDDRIMAGQNHKEGGTDGLQLLGNGELMEWVLPGWDS